MKCFRHHEKDAVGMCKACNRGLCESCAVQLAEGLSCAGDCETEVKRYSELVNQSASRLESSRWGAICFVSMCITGAAIFIIAGLIESRPILLVLGIALAFGGLALLPRAFRGSSSFK